jgi:hypothetical protein
MYYLICFAPVIIIILYCFYLLIRQKNIHDDFFHLSRKTTKETMIERIKMLEEMNQVEYRLDIMEIEKIYKDGIVTESEADRMEEIITNSYFNNFYGKWSAFKHADLSMKIIFIMCLAYGFVYVNLIFVIGIPLSSRYPISVPTSAVIFMNASLILPFLFSLVLLGFFSMFLSMLNIPFNEYGGINRAAITSTELIRSLKPGGRKTKIVLGTAWSKSGGFFRI